MEFNSNFNRSVEFKFLAGQMSQDGFVVHNGTTKTIRTGIVYDERVLKHINAKPGSPETAERVQVCFEKLKRTKLLDQCELIGTQRHC